MPRPKYPPVAEGYRRITYSDLTTYLLCGELMRRQIDERHRWATVKMLTGSGTAGAAAFDNQCKLNQLDEPSLGMLIDWGIHCYDKEVADSEVEETQREICKGRDDTAACVRAFAQRVSPRVRTVLAVEEPIVAIIADGLELAGTPDWIQEEGPDDLKTGRPWTRQRAEESRQLTGYGLLYKARTRKWPKRVAIHSVYDGNRYQCGGKETSTFVVPRTTEDYADFVRIAQRVVEGMSAGVFLPAQEGHWKCRRAWCPAWGSCLYVTGRRKRESW